MPSNSHRTVLSPAPTTQITLPLHSLSTITSLTSSPPNLIYATTSSPSPSLILLTLSLTSPTTLTFIRHVVTPHPITSIHVAPHLNTLLILSSDGYIYSVDSLLEHPLRKLTSIKPVTAFSIHQLTNYSNSDNSIYGNNAIYSNNAVYGNNGNGGVFFGGKKRREFSKSCIVAAVVMGGKRVVFLEVGVKGEGGEVVGVVIREVGLREGVVVKELAWVDDECLVLGTRGGYSLMECGSGEVREIFLVPGDGTEGKGVKVLERSKEVMLMVDNVGIVVDGKGQPVGGSLVFRGEGGGGGVEGVGEMGGYVVCVGGGKLELYYKKSGVCVQRLGFGGGESESGGVGPCVLGGGEDGSGEFVVVAAASKVICYHRLPAEEQIKLLLRKKNFKEAITLMEELEVEGDISREMLSFVHAQLGFLLLFDLHFEEAVDHFLRSETLQPSEIFPFVIRDPNRWSLLVPRNRYWGLHPPPVHVEDVVEDGLLAIQRAMFLKKAGLEAAIDDQFLLNPPSRADLLNLGFKSIIRYLQVSRNKDLSSPVKEGVDTLLMYLYRTLNCSEEMEKLASSDNSCVVEELETLLEESGHLRTLAFLYANKKLNSKALAIWRLLARNYPSGLQEGVTEMDDTDDTSLLPVCCKEVAAIEASKILEESADVELVLQHLGWISEVSEELAVRVLTSEKRTNPLPPDNVLVAVDPRKVEILQRYLQWLIENQDSSDTQLHTLYALSLAKSAIETLETEISVKNPDSRGLIGANNCGFERNAPVESHTRQRLQFFLHSSDLYDVNEVLELIEGSELWLEKAILYRKLGQETLVLQILALKLEDSEAAEQYCAELGRPDAYMQLLDMYLNPQNGKEPMFKAAVRLLHSHGESLDPLQVLERLSPDMPLQLASETILRMLRARLHHHHQGKIVHSLSGAVDVDAKLARFEERARHVQINDESLCDSCHARLGTKLFAMYPDDSIVCYKCFRRQGESTSVAGRNFKEDILVKPGWLVSR